MGAEGLIALSNTTAKVHHTEQKALTLTLPSAE